MVRGCVTIQTKWLDKLKDTSQARKSVGSERATNLSRYPYYRTMVGEIHVGSVVN